ncbi:MAG: PepSY domain-containing protein [Methylotenera sp.]|uniref:PepSY domain-containing protein n=1 Tax=Methylotenera sp. TaxID=2051956 RepID=UPI0027164657|nr:PepSY domain-containing protein [Methylotenera sp.]MDO9150074.1 PepSY domain-containing protein [Methylotenera sp.]
MKKSMNIFTLASVISITLLSPLAFADNDIQKIEAISKELGLITLEQAKAKALAAKPGVVDDVELENRKFGKGWDYEFEIVDADGREWEVLVDAKTGVVRDVSREWF